MSEFVIELLRSQDNIIDQLKVLKEHKNHKEVKMFIKDTVKYTDSPYQLYCINKYFYGKDVPEVKPKIPRLYPKLCPKEELIAVLESCDNIIDQLNLLSEYKDDEKIAEYVVDQLKYDRGPYVEYCMDKYFYGEYVPEVEPTAKTLGIVLIDFEIPSLLKKQEKQKMRKDRHTLKKVKVGDAVKVLEGPFSNMVGKVDTVDKKNAKLIVLIPLFGTDTPCEIEGKFEIVK